MAELFEKEQSRRVVTFDAGEYLFRQDEMTQDLFILKSGSVRIYKTEGGVEIEKVAEQTPEKILKTTVHPLVGVQPYQSMGPKGTPGD